MDKIVRNMHTPSGRRSAFVPPPNAHIEDLVKQLSEIQQGRFDRYTKFEAPLAANAAFLDYVKVASWLPAQPLRRPSLFLPTEFLQFLAVPTTKRQHILRLRRMHPKQC